MSGLRSSRMPPADIFIGARQWEHGHGGGVKKTSLVTVNRPIGTDVKLGLLLRDSPPPAQRVIMLEFRNSTTNALIGRATEIRNAATDPDWSGAITALGRFIDPGADRHWALFALPPLDVEFVSELTLVPPPTPPDQREVPVVAIHVNAGDSADTIRARMRQGAYGFGVSVVRAADDDWTRESKGGDRGQ